LSILRKSAEKIQVSLKSSTSAIPPRFHPHLWVTNAVQLKASLNTTLKNTVKVNKSLYRPEQDLRSPRS
jgi:hypothetical protein